ncbi:MAG TPA: hypothetical protein VGR71_10710 [Nitrospira sp.]|nr:hypothetical protein [Nitrospira sp.]
MRIAVLGWGSLVWDPGDLLIVDNAWHKGGPVLPIELSRLSSRRGHFTYVIDPTNGARVPTRYGISVYEVLEDAIGNLARREACASTAIGYTVSNDSELHRARKGVPWEEIRKWAQHAETDAAIWTDLGPKLLNSWNEWSVERALHYWKTAIPPDRLPDAARYASSAPPEIDTEFRRGLIKAGLIAQHGVVEILDSRTSESDLTG